MKIKRKKSWTHKKFGKKTYTGSYEKSYHGGERVFVLTADKYSDAKNANNRLTFESHEAARKLGWLAN